jgi:hypothetical protein
MLLWSSLAVLGITLSAAESSSSSSQSSVLNSIVAGGATQLQSNEERGVLGLHITSKTEDEVILIKKRDGGREPLDGAKVRIVFETTQDFHH